MHFQENALKMYKTKFSEIELASSKVLFFERPNKTVWGSISRLMTLVHGLLYR